MAPGGSTYSLRVDLADVGETLGQGIGGHLVAVLVSELGSFTLCSLRKGSSVGDGSSNNAANARGYLKDVRDGSRVDQLVLLMVSVLFKPVFTAWYLDIRGPSFATERRRSPFRECLQT